MPMTLTIRDETSTGKTLNELSLEFLTERITVRELIRSRVYQEVKDVNARAANAPANMLVQPAEDERTLNGIRSRKPRFIDWQKQFDIALEAYQRRGFLILVDDKQTGDLDDEITLRAETRVSFLKLVPLVGG